MLTVVADGTLSSDNTQRVFGVEIQLPAVKSGVLHISLNCSSPAEDFAFLDKEGDTYIHSTVRGSCITTVVQSCSKNILAYKICAHSRFFNY